jgi:hypothetical protein
MDNEDKIGQCFVVIRALVLPTLIEQIIELFPLLKLQHSFKFKLDYLKVL